MDFNEYLDLDLNDSTYDPSFPTTFGSCFLSEISEALRPTTNEIGGIWVDMGLPSNKRDEKIALLKEAFLETAKKFHDGEFSELKKQQNYHEFQLNEINKILKALSMDEYVVDTNRTLLARNKLLSLKYKELLFIKNERMENLRLITDKLKKVYHSLGIAYPAPIFATNIPSEIELSTLRIELSNIEQQLISQKKHYETLKSFLTKYQMQLEYIPENSQEEIMLASSNDIIYSKQNVSLISDFHKKIVKLYNDEKAKIEDLKYLLTKLFTRLDIDETVQKAFFQSLTGSFPRQKKLLNGEIEKYELLKKSCMERIIKNIRKNLDQLFQQCMVSVFNDTILESEEFTEELLDLHESEYSKLDQFNSLYLGVFDKLREWHESLEKLLELEKKLLDPNRFNNRGGALLLNERDRRLLTKKLPRIEKEIKSMVTMIESKENIPFSSYGMDINEFFESNWDHFKEEKNNHAKNMGTKKSGPDSTKKPTTSYGSSQKKNLRFPFSPRTNNCNRKAVPVSRQLFNGNSSEKMIDNEMEFQKHLLNKDQLQSTFLAESGAETKKFACTSQSKLIRTPIASKLPMKNARRLSRSCDNLATQISKEAETYGVTKRVKRPPFLP